MNFKQINLKNFNFNVFSRLSNDWALLAAGDEQNHNAMTISWGGFGILWHKIVASVYVRPQRYTKKFIDANLCFTINFFDEKFKPKLQFYGTNSGKNCNKDLKTGLTVEKFDETVGYSSANLVLVCKKLYVDEFNKNNFINTNLIKQFYEDDIFHYVYISEILQAFSKQ